jgi:hypothetical protein
MADPHSLLMVASRRLISGKHIEKFMTLRSNIVEAEYFVLVLFV